jgi:hypothetical protein
MTTSHSNAINSLQSSILRTLEEHPEGMTIAELHGFDPTVNMSTFRHNVQSLSRKGMITFTGKRKGGRKLWITNPNGPEPTDSPHTLAAYRRLQKAIGVIDAIKIGLPVLDVRGLAASDNDELKRWVTVCNGAIKVIMQLRKDIKEAVK